MNEEIKKVVLPNGVRLLFERLPHVRSATVGFWIDVGSRNETEPEGGLSHFVEHMLFKGTSRRDSLRLSHDMNLLGGNFNAFTTQENICLSAKVVDEHLPATLDLLAEMLFDSTMEPIEVDRERNVILEEVKMYDDTPDEFVIDVFMSNLYDGNALGRPILGATENLTRFQREDLKRFTGREFTPDRLVVSLAGNFDIPTVEAQLTRLFSPAHRNGSDPNPLQAPVPAYKSHNVDRKLEQVHFCMGTEGPARTAEDRFAFAVLTTILGGGNSSRIFQEVREKRGLAYSIGSFDYAFKDTGCVAISGGSSPKNAPKVVSICLEEVKKIYSTPVTEDELISAKEQIKSSLLLSMESSSSRMARMAECELYFGQYIPVEYSVGKIAAVNLDDVLAVSEKYLKERPVTFASIGPEKKFEPYLSGMTF